MSLIRHRGDLWGDMASLRASLDRDLSAKGSSFEKHIGTRALWLNWPVITPLPRRCMKRAHLQS